MSYIYSRIGANIQFIIFHVHTTQHTYRTMHSTSLATVLCTAHPANIEWFIIKPWSLAWLIDYDNKNLLPSQNAYIIWYWRRQTAAFHTQRCGMPQRIGTGTLWWMAARQPACQTSKCIEFELILTADSLFRLTAKYGMPGSCAWCMDFMLDFFLFLKYTQ